MDGQIIINFIVKYFYWAFLGWILMMILQRRHGNKGNKKRMAVLFQAILIFFVMAYAMILKMNDLTDSYLIIAGIIVILILFFGRKKILPYQRTCRVCGKPMSIERIFYYDDPLCQQHDTDEIEKED